MRGVQGDLAHSTCPVGPGVDGKGVAGTEGNVREAMRDVCAVERVWYSAGSGYALGGGVT